MSLEVEINLNSLKMVEEELGRVIAQSATEFEAFLADQKDRTLLRDAMDKIAQIGGTFRLLEIPGAALIADEMAQLLIVIADDSQKTNDSMLKALTHAYFVLPRYIEHITIAQKALPTLVIPYVNEMRVSRREKLLPEYHFIKPEFPTLGLAPTNEKPCQMDLLLNNAKRLNHMFQAALVGMIREPHKLVHFQYAARALDRVVELLGDHPRGEVLKLAALVLKCFSASKLELTLNRKRNLGSIEKLLRALATKGEQALESQDEALIHDLLFMLMLTSYSGADIDAIRQVYSLPTIATSDDVIVARRKTMHGPSIETLETVIAVLNDELRNAKDILELGSKNGLSDEDQAALAEVLSRVSDTLSIMNMKGPRQVLLQQVAMLNQSGEDSKALGASEFVEIADTLLYVESALSGLNKREISVEDLNDTSDTARAKIIADNLLALAEKIVIEESLSGVLMVKRAISSYVDSGFDSIHVSNVAVTLDTVGGGLKVLKFHRAAAVLKSCSDFVASHMKSSNPDNERQQLLETLADTLISLEYYLNELITSRNVNEKILDVAEESLAALGFAVEI